MGAIDALESHGRKRTSDERHASPPRVADGLRKALDLLVRTGQTKDRLLQSRRRFPIAEKFILADSIQTGRLSSVMTS
jgi:hypothetical protein